MSDERSSSSAGEVQWQHQPHVQTASAFRVRLFPTRQSSVYSLASNDDALERAKAHAVRAAASRRHPAIVPETSRPLNDSSSQKYFSRERVAKLLHNCLKLSQENKINQKNSWDLELIDHLGEIIRTDSDADADTNFQQASCSLEVGVKIYSARVDSVHLDAYKVLSSVIRVGRDDDKAGATVYCQKEWSTKEEPESKTPPLSTVAASFKELNTTKFDAAFIVDPLYHQTSAKFDEGGVKGLLLNSLGIYGSCKLLFDSFEDPRKDVGNEKTFSRLEKIDLAFAKEEVLMMLNCMPTNNSISPTLNCIINLLNEDNERPPNVLKKSTNTREPYNTSCSNEVGSEAHDAGHWNSDTEDQCSTVDDDSAFIHFATSQEDHEPDNHDGTLHRTHFNDVIGKVFELLSLQKGVIFKPNSWAGLDHWEYNKAKGPQQFPGSTRLGAGLATKRKEKVRKHHSSDFGFSRVEEKMISDIFVPPRNSKSLLPSSGKDPCEITLPEDCHYQPEGLVKLFFLPDKLCFHRNGRTYGNESQHENISQNQSGYWADETANDDQYNGDQTSSDISYQGDLVPQPHQVCKAKDQHDKVSKNIDIHALKRSLWEHMQAFSDTLECSDALPFSKVLRALVNRQQTSFPENLSPHLCVVCLMQLANEEHLKICDCGSLDELYIYRT